VRGVPEIWGVPGDIGTRVEPQSMSSPPSWSASEVKHEVSISFTHDKVQGEGGRIRIASCMARLKVPPVSHLRDSWSSSLDCPLDEARILVVLLVVMVG